MRNSTILCKYRKRLPYHSTCSSLRTTFQKMRPRLENSLEVLCSAYDRVCEDGRVAWPAWWWWLLRKEIRRKRQKSELSISSPAVKSLRKAFGFLVSTWKLILSKNMLSWGNIYKILQTFSNFPKFFYWDFFLSFWIYLSVINMNTLRAF